MTTLQASPAQHARVADEATVEFRVSRPGLPRRRLRLVGPAYTLGSGAQCSVRLDDPLIRAVHATLLCQDAQVVLKSLGAAILVNGVAATETVLRPGDRFQLGTFDFELLGPPTPEASLQTGTTPREKVPAETEPAATESATNGPAGNTPVDNTPAENKIVPRRRRLSFLDLKEMPVGNPVAAVPTPPAAATSGQNERNRDTFDSHRAIVANERHWQQRSKRQLERFRLREQRRRAQIEALRAGQEAADRRARQAEDAVNALRSQLTDLAGRVSAISGTVMPGIEERIEQQQQDVVVASRQTQTLVDSLRSRLEFVQTSIASLQAETREIHQQSAANRQDHQETAANADQLERMLQTLGDQQENLRTAHDAKIDEMRSDLHQMSIKVTETSSQLEETRQGSHAMGALIQGLRSSLQNLQSDAERFATLEQLAKTQQDLVDNEDRLAQLVQDYELHSRELQNDWEAMRQRIEDAEELAERTSLAAAEVLNRTALTPNTPAAHVDAPPADALLLEQGVVEQISSEEIATEQQERLCTDESVLEQEVDEPRYPYHLADEHPVWQPDVSERSESVYDQEEAVEQDSVELELGEEEYKPASFVDSFYDGQDSEQEYSGQEYSKQEYSKQEYSEQQYSEQQYSEQQYSDGPAHAEEKLADQEDAAPQWHRLETGDSAADPEEPLWSSEDGAELHDDAYSEGSTYQLPGDGDSKGLLLGAAESDVPASDTALEPRWSVDACEDNTRQDEHEEEVPSRAIFSDSAAGASDTARAGDSTPAYSEALVEEDEDSIEAYMNRLLKRVGGGDTQGPASVTRSTVPAPSRPASAPGDTRSSTPQTSGAQSTGAQSTGAQSTGTQSGAATSASATPDVSTSAAADGATPKAASTPEPYVPRSQAPERTSSLAAMRELANSSARSAIAISARRRTLNQIVFKFSLFALGVVAGLAVLAGSNFAADKWLLVAICCFALATFYLVEGFGMRKQLVESDGEAPSEQPA